MTNRIGTDTVVIGDGLTINGIRYPVSVADEFGNGNAKAKRRKKKMAKKERIKKAIESLKTEKKDMYTIKELETIARAAKVELLDVMYFLRYGK